MRTESLKKQRILTVAALLFLLCTRWMFYRLELEPDINTPLFIAEGVAILLVCGLCVFRAPLPVPLIASFAVETALCVLYAVYGAFTAPDFLQPLVYLPVFLFLIGENGYEQAKAFRPFAAAGPVLTVFVSVGALGLTVYASAEGNVTFKTEFFFSLFLAAAVSVLYIFIMKTPVRTKDKKTGRGHTKPGGRTRSAFQTAAAAIICCGVYLAARRQYAAANTLALLWAANLILLYGGGHPAVNAFADRFRNKVLQILNADSDSGAQRQKGGNPRNDLQ